MGALGHGQMGCMVMVCSPTPQLPTTGLVLGATAKPQCSGGFGHPQGWTWPPACSWMLPAAAGEGSLGCSPQHPLHACAMLLISI